ncbi:MAG: phenylphosphate carboxylase subunit alpha [Deltaproteobacteria bacterium]|nr:phenylphosphate carboxylase subunit alpha [Deltaproteobacteria bacterium]MBW2128490.1 phenylphosphate carboxylase subunit alpha [Deltaproteobacteria bacterium]MBW2303651.1 phenylphosphate carboxylase subunit alpha [Deltaproteobacteria bacterium]
MAYTYPKDNREFINLLKKYGDLVTVEQEVDWDLEMGAIVRRVCEKKLPSPYFKKIKDYPGFEALGAPLATYRRLAIAMGLGSDASIPEIAEEYVRRTTAEPIPPVLIDRKDAPCKDNILMGEEADLFKLPAPMVHDGDGGRYLATWHFVVSKDPETKDINWGMYRQMVFDEKTMVGPVLPFSDMGKMFYGKFVPKNEPMPFATVIACDPLSGVAASAPSPIPEDQFAGMLMGEPVELVKCETCDLEVPAHAEIIIEGEVIPNMMIEEAPFGEYTGYRTSPREPRTVYRVKAITYRNNPILTVSNMGVPTDEGQLLRSFSLGLEMRKLLESQGIPITGVYMLPESTHHLVVVGVKPAYSGIASQIAGLIFGSKLSPWFHMVIVVDHETDIYSKDEVIHALSTKCHPIRGIHKYDQAPGTPLNPYASPEERKWSRGAKVLFDCTFPLDWPKSDLPIKVAFNTVYPREIQERVLSNWKNYGFQD